MAIPPNAPLAAKLLNPVFRRLVFPVNDLVFQQNITYRLSFLEQAQWWPRPRIEAYQRRELARLIQTAWDDVPFYRDLMQEAGVTPADIREPADLHRLPMVTKDMIRPNYPDRMVRDTGQKAFEVSSSGSTGKNFFVMKDNETRGLNKATHLMNCLWAGWTPGEAAMQMGISPNRGLQKSIKDFVLRTWYVSAFDLSDRAIDQNLDIMQRYGISHLWGYAGGLHAMAMRAKARGWNRPLRSIMSWGENLFAHYRQGIEEVFGVGVTDTYGCGEGILVSCQIGGQGLYYVNDFDTIVQFVDDHGRPVPAGTLGNIILTRLHPGPMPLIRYQVGDIGISGPTSTEPGTRQLSTMQSIQGRDTDIILTPGGNRLVVHFFTGILEHHKSIAVWQVEQTELARAVLRVVPSGTWTEASESAILADLKDHGTDDLHFDLQLVDEIPLEKSNKRRFVISRLKDTVKIVA